MAWEGFSQFQFGIYMAFRSLSISCRITLFFKCFPWAKNTTISTGRLTQEATSFHGEIPEWGIARPVCFLPVLQLICWLTWTSYLTFEPQDPWLYDNTQDCHFEDQIKLMNERPLYNMLIAAALQHTIIIAKVIHHVLLLHMVDICILSASHFYSKTSEVRFCQAHLPPWSCAFDKPSLLIFAFPTFPSRIYLELTTTRPATLSEIF